MKLELRHISREFPGVKALQDVSLKIEPGKVHAICGENGAGKSTLLNILSGNLQADSGKIFLDGEEVCFAASRDAFDRGIAIVYQHLSLVSSLSIAENIYGIDPPRSRYGFLKTRMMISRAGQLLEQLGLDRLNPRQPVKSLSAGERQMVEIAKALANDPKIIFFDEPTASVSERDAGVIFRIIERLKKNAVAVVYISHRLSEIFRLSDDITVLKDGKVQGTFSADSLNEQSLIRLMVGRDMIAGETRRRPDAGFMLEVEGISGPGFRDVSFSVRSGEIFGIGGLVGAGRTEIAQAIFGASGITSGTVRLKGKQVSPPAHTLDAIRLGIGYVPEDRKSLGIFEQCTVAENIYISDLSVNPGINFRKMNEIAEQYCEILQIRTPSIHKKAGELSGGNQQKLLIARWLNMNVEVLIMDEPTQGIDIGARYEIYRVMRKFAESGKCILLISSEMNELINLCDRILVVREGRNVGILETADVSEEQILSLAMQ